MQREDATPNPESVAFFERYINEKLPPLVCDEKGILVPDASVS